MAASSVRRALRVVVYASIPLLVLLLLTELLLWGLGLGDPREALSATRGFDASERYLVPDPEVPGGWRTQMFGAGMEQHEEPIGPRDDRLRVLMMGGSNTQGFPLAYLRARLNETLGTPRFDIVNLGRLGYGSERVRILLEQAMVLEPDVVVIYCGHNEFMEAGFAMELREVWAGPIAERIGVAATRLRLVNLLASAFAVDARTQAERDRRPEARRARDERFERFEYADTRLFLDEYQRNLASMCETAIAGGARVVLCTLVGNMLSPPWTSTLPHAWTEDETIAFAVKLSDVRRGIPPKFGRGTLFPPLRLSQVDWGQGVPPDERAARAARGLVANRGEISLRPLSGLLADTAASDEPKMISVAGAHWPDPAWWEPQVFELLTAVAAIHERELTERQRTRLRETIPRYEALLEACDDHPSALFELGLCHYVLGEVERGVELIALAGSRDRAPRKASAVSNELVREVAARYDEVQLLDVERAFAACCPDGLVGYEVVADVCHLQPGARKVLMDVFHDLLLALREEIEAERAAPR